MRRGRSPRGQSLVEFALIGPLLFLLIAGIMTFGIGVFYQQQLTNAAREAARYAAIHSATSQCPTVSNLPPHLSMLPPDFVNYECDPPRLGWPFMTAHARSHVWGIDRSQVHVAACWSGFWDNDTGGYDAGPFNDGTGTPNEFRTCTIAGADPLTENSELTCPAPPTTAADDKASSLAHSGIGTANQVTVYACYDWRPPFGGLAFPIPCPDGWCEVEIVPSVVGLKAAITEAMQHQQ